VNARSPARGGGFTLIEVVVAMAIIVVVLAGLFFQINRVADTAIDLRERTLAQWIALNRVAELRVNGVPPVGQKAQGTIEYADERWRWQSEVLPTPVKEIQRIRVQVGLERDPKDRWTATVDSFAGSAIVPPGVGGDVNWRGTPTGGPGGPPAAPGGGAPTS
jgi:general secretion pathway protein I